MIYKKFIVIIFILSIMFSIKIGASANSIYEEQYEASNIESVYGKITDDAKEILDNYGITAENYDWINELTAENIFKEIWNFVKLGGKDILKNSTIVFICLIIWSMTGNMFASDKLKSTASYGIVLITITVIILPISSLVINGINTVKSLSVFMLSFIPIYSGILLAGGQTIASTGFSSIMLVLTEGISQFTSAVISPISAMYLSLGISNSFLEELHIVEIGNTLKKIGIWVMSLISVIFIGVLRVQNVIGHAVDSTFIRALRFVAGSTVPIVGNAVSESILTVKSCIELLGSTVSVFGIIAVSLMVLPILIKLLLWRVSMLLLGSVSAVFDCRKIKELTAVIDQTLTLLIGIILFISLMFIVSLTVVTILGK